VYFPRDGDPHPNDKKVTGFTEIHPKMEREPRIQKFPSNSLHLLHAATIPLYWKILENQSNQIYNSLFTSFSPQSQMSSFSTPPFHLLPNGTHI